MALACQVSTLAAIQNREMSLTSSQSLNASVVHVTLNTARQTQVLMPLLPK